MGNLTRRHVQWRCRWFRVKRGVFSTFWKANVWPLMKRKCLLLCCRQIWERIFYAAAWKLCLSFLKNIMDAKWFCWSMSTMCHWQKLLSEAIMIRWSYSSEICLSMPWKQMTVWNLRYWPGVCAFQKKVFLQDWTILKFCLWQTYSLMNTLVSQIRK